MLQIFNLLDALIQAGAQRGQWLFGERRASFGGIALPSQCIGNVELRRCDQAFRFHRPIRCNMLLRGAALQFIELLAQRLGRTFVAVRELFEDFLHLLRRRVFTQPFADFGGTLTRGGRRKCAARQGIEWMRGGVLGSFGGGSVLHGVVRFFVKGRKAQHDRKIRGPPEVAATAYFRCFSACRMRNQMRNAENTQMRNTECTERTQKTQKNLI